MYSIGLDIGTTKICAILIDNESGEIKSAESSLNNTDIIGKPFEHLQDPEKSLK